MDHARFYRFSGSLLKERKKIMAKKPKTNRLLGEFRRKGGGARQTTLRVLGDKLDRYGALFQKEHLLFEDAREGPRSVDIVQTNTCSFGHTIDDKIRVAGICDIGGEVLGFNVEE